MKDETLTINAVWPNGRAVLACGNGSENAAIYPPNNGCLAFPGCPIFPKHWAVVWWYPSRPNRAPKIEIFADEQDARDSVERGIGRISGSYRGATKRRAIAKAEGQT